MANLPVVSGPPRPQFPPQGQIRPSWPPQQQQMAMGPVMVESTIRTPGGSAKRPHVSAQQVAQSGQTLKPTGPMMSAKRRKKIADKILPPQVRDQNKLS